MADSVGAARGGACGAAAAGAQGRRPARRAGGAAPAARVRLLHAAGDTLLRAHRVRHLRQYGDVSRLLFFKVHLLVG